ncbi:YgiQ family radical SAM protein [Candidatus Woesearchaeota archaeon]|nr:YgiQ family radical SAM protein [Candidatus Woesearchaeota archaeon]
MRPFIPTTSEEMRAQGIKQCDVIIVSGDAYVDHPAFGAAVLGRFLQAHGFSVGIIAQPDWTKKDDFQRLGEPALCFAVTAGNMDSMVAHYTPMKRRREEDMMSPSGKAGLRPDKPTIAYTNRLKELFTKPIVIGGVEASLRRFAHYDYIENRLRKSILLDAKADILVYGFAEKAFLEVVRRLRAGAAINDIPNTVTKAKAVDCPVMPSYEECLADKKQYAEAFRLFHLQTTKKIAQRHGDWYVVQQEAMRFTSADVDFVAELPYRREAHPASGDVPGLRTVLFSVSTHRGCFGGCSFCAITYHQGRDVVSRSEESILREIRDLTKHPAFKGEIFDLGGATANMWHMDDGKINHKPLIELMRKARAIPGVRHVFVRSGIRYDLAMQDEEYMRELLAHHVSGNLKIAPEHVSPQVTALMHKPAGDSFARFLALFRKITTKVGKPQQKVVPYFMAAHPGTGVKEMKELVRFTKKHDCYNTQVQVFTPTPMTLSTAMYYTGINPLTRQPVFVPYTYREKKLQKAMLLYKENKKKEFTDDFS